MKNKSRWLLVLPFTLMAVLLFGCNGTKYYNISKNHLSEIRYNLFVAENEHVKVSFMSGQREKEYVIDGTSSTLTNFGVVTFTVLDSKQNTEGATYQVTVGTQVFSGALEENPFDHTLVADIQTIVENTATVTAKITIGEWQQQLTLSSVSQNWVVDHNEALKIACKQLQKSMESMMVEGQFCAEGYIKIVHDDDVNKNQYYWYVNFVTKENKNAAVIIDPMSKGIMAQKEIS